MPFLTVLFAGSGTRGGAVIPVSPTVTKSPQKPGGFLLEVSRESSMETLMGGFWGGTEVVGLSDLPGECGGWEEVTFVTTTFNAVSSFLLLENFLGILRWPNSCGASQQFIAPLFRHPSPYLARNSLTESWRFFVMLSTDPAKVFRFIRSRMDFRRCFGHFFAWVSKSLARAVFTRQESQFGFIMISNISSSSAAFW